MALGTVQFHFQYGFTRIGWEVLEFVQVRIHSSSVHSLTFFHVFKDTYIYRLAEENGIESVEFAYYFHAKHGKNHFLDEDGCRRQDGGC